MTILPPTTRSRLQKITQTSGIWEGDRRPLGSLASHLEGNKDAEGECVIWVDGSEGAVRAIDVVTEDTGIEAVVRTLLRAIESPHHPGQPYRPQKIVVRNREIQFFLRGVLQGLDIDIEYSPQLPLIDRLFAGFAEMDDSQPSALPALYEQAITDIAHKIWENAPWELLADSDILRVELKNCEIDQVYLCTMGMMSAEYGVLLYRSLDSLKQFRAAAIKEHKSPAELEQAFLAQDCWFLNYEELEAENFLEEMEVEPFFGSLHPFEGMRPFLDEAETKIIYAALASLVRLCRQHRSALADEPIAALSKSYRITIPGATGNKETTSTKISTLPELTQELLSLGMSDFLDSDSQEIELPIQEDLIPDGALISMTSVSGELIEQLKSQPKTYYQSLDVEFPAQELPTIFVQTTRPKAKEIITKIRDSGGLKAICFNPGNDPFSGEIYDLGMMQTGDDELFIFAEYSQAVAQQATVVEKWHQRCQKTQGYCGLIIAMGATGANRGAPQAKDMLALFEVKSINGAELGMGMLQLMPSFEL